MAPLVAGAAEAPSSSSPLPSTSPLTHPTLDTAAPFLSHAHTPKSPAVIPATPAELEHYYVSYFRLFDHLVYFISFLPSPTTEALHLRERES